MTDAPPPVVPLPEALREALDRYREIAFGRGIACCVTVENDTPDAQERRKNLYAAETAARAAFVAALAPYLAAMEEVKIWRDIGGAARWETVANKLAADRASLAVSQPLGRSET